MSELTELYSKDYTAWAQRTAALIRAGAFAQLDIEHLLEELEGMGASERNELESRFIILLAHLLKWQYQYRQLSERWREFDGRSWRQTIIEQRTRIARRLRKSPGLKTILAEVVEDVYPDAVVLAVKESGLPAAVFPAFCLYSTEQLLNDDFYPPMESGDGYKGAS